MKEIPQDTGVDTCAIKQENSFKKKNKEKKKKKTKKKKEEKRMEQ